jgi:oxygen-independent coproporphyrinogen III oxidase
MEPMVDGIIEEINRTIGFLQGATVGTVYLGGGTPSLVPDRGLRRLLAALAVAHTLEEGAEITLEANPDDIDEARLLAWKAAGVNRLSIGVQSFRDQDLQWMNRAHSAAAARHSISLAREAGFHHDSIDLIYGIPGLSDTDLRANIEEAVALGCPHISCYALTVEARTALAKDIQQGKMPPVDTDQQARQFLLVVDQLTTAGYEHYEISNFALPGHRSKHNSSYWQGVPYLGLGPAAHSFDGRIRRWNVSNNALYLQSMSKGIVPFEEEVLTPVQRLNEYVMTALRTVEGVDLERVEKNWGTGALRHIEEQGDHFASKGWTDTLNGKILLTREGKLFADGIAANMFLEEGDL